MARRRYRQGPWPPTTDDQTNCAVQAPDCIERTDRSLAGPLRMGTAPRVGPRGAAVDASDTRASDFGMDRVTPRGFDPMGTSLARGPAQQNSSLIARTLRARRSD